jgi:hypothetical protein
MTIGYEHAGFEKWKYVNNLSWTSLTYDSLLISGYSLKDHHLEILKTVSYGSLLLKSPCQSLATF